MRGSREIVSAAGLRVFGLAFVIASAGCGLTNAFFPDDRNSSGPIDIGVGEGEGEGEIPPCTGFFEPIDLQTSDFTSAGGFLDDGSCEHKRATGGCGDSQIVTHFEGFDLFNVDVEPLSVEVTANYDFDGFLAAYDAIAFDENDGGFGCLSANDDDFDTSNSRVNFILPVDGVVKLIVSGLDRDFVGSFSLEISTQ